MFRHLLCVHIALHEIYILSENKKKACYESAYYFNVAKWQQIPPKQYLTAFTHNSTIIEGDTSPTT